MSFHRTDPRPINIAFHFFFSPPRMASSRLLLLLLLSIVVLCAAYRGPLTRIRKTSLLLTKTMTMMTDEVLHGKPVIKKIDEDKKIAYMTVALSGEQTQKAFNTACDMFNEVIILQ